MAKFKNYPCWTPEGAAALPVEAVVASRAFFFATHTPLTIYRANNEGARPEPPGAPLNEEAVCRELLSSPTRGGVLLLPVIGESGTGKSHLVRWVREKTDSTDKIQVIYLPKKQTSLRGVVEALLAEVESAELNQLRAKVKQMSSELDEKGLQQRLLNQLQEALVAAPRESGKAGILSGTRGLGVLLLDPYVREHLLRKDALIPRMAASLLHDRRDGESDRPVEFRVDDLPLDIADVNQAAAPTKGLFRHLIADPALQLAAVRMLNELLPMAVMNATIGTGHLQDAMLAVRRELARQGKEIILLIEDFAVIQGIQRDLLDAIIEVADRDGRREFAPIRTLMAVTTGYYKSLPETVKTRIPHTYDLDVQFNPDAGMDEMASFVGRYLNAARLGPDKLDGHWTHDDDDVPNACKDCEFRDVCRADNAFGQSKEGYGLYPFNKPALRRAIRSRPAPGDHGDAFNPRLVIDRVVRNVLLEHGPYLVDGQFPDKQFNEEYRPRRKGEEGYSEETRETVLSADVDAVLSRDLGAEEGSRYATFLQFWGDAGASVDSLSLTMYEAFDMRPDAIKISDLGAAKSDDSEGTVTWAGDDPEPRPPRTELPGTLQRNLNWLNDWSQRGEELDLNLARQLREVIRDAVIQQCAWNDPLMPEPTSKQLDAAWPARSTVVSIDGAYGERVAATADAPITFTRSSPNAVYFRGLLLANAGVFEGRPWAKGEHVTRAARAIRRLARDADRNQGHLQQAVARSANITDGQLASGVLASLIGATLAGKAMPSMNDAELLAVVFDEGTTWERQDISDSKWASTLNKHLEARQALVTSLRSGLGVSRGQGGVRMIDAARALPMLQKAVKSWRWDMPSTDLAPWIRKAVGGFAEWDGLLESQISALTRQLVEIRSLLPRGTSLSDTIDAVNTAILAATEAGTDQMAPAMREQLKALADQAGQRDWRSTERLESDLGKAGAEAEAEQRHRARIVAAARDRGTDIAVIRQFLSASNVWLTNALNAAKKQEGGAGQVAEERVRGLLSTWTAIDGEG